MQNENKKRYLYSSTGSFVFALGVLLFVQVFLHYDFWLMGKQTIILGLLPSEVTYRFIMTVIGIPLIQTILQKVSWPVPE